MLPEQMRMSSSPATGIGAESSAALRRTYSTSSETSSFLRRSTAQDFPLPGGSACLRIR